MYQQSKTAVHIKLILLKMFILKSIVPLHQYLFRKIFFLAMLKCTFQILTKIGNKSKPNRPSMYIINLTIKREKMERRE